MELLIKLSLVLTTYLQIVRSQPNLAAIWGLGALGDLGDSGMGGFPGMGGMSSQSSNSNCPYQAHPNKFKFTQMVNNRLMTQECAPGTMFVLSKCSCDNIPTGGVGANMPGSNPRMEVGLGGGGNSLLNALVSQLQGGGGQSPNLQPPPSPAVRSRSPPMSNHITGSRPRVSSGIRPDQKPGSSRNPPSTGSRVSGIQYNPDPSSGLTSVVDPSVLPNVLPPEILQILSASSGNRAPGPPGPTPVSPRRSSTGRNHPQSPTNQQQVNVASLAASGMPPEVLQMLQRSMGPPPSATNNKPPQQQPSSSRRLTPTGSSSPRMVAPTRATKTSQPRRAPQSVPVPIPTSRSQMMPPSGSRQDPFAALLGGLQAPRTQPTRRTSSPQSDPFAALMAGMGGGNSQSSSSNMGMGGDPMAALLAGLGGGSGGMGGSSGGALAALLGSSSGSPSRPGGPLDVTSLTGNMNVAALLGETPGRGLVQNVDMTSLFNAQGQMGAGGGIAALSGINNIDILKLQQLDRQGVIDISDLTPAGLAAANAHFG